MKTEDYKNKVADTANYLIEAREKLFELAFHLAMTGELNEWQKEFPLGEQFTFNTELMNALDDTNIQLIAHLQKTMLETIKQLNNEN